MSRWLITGAGGMLGRDLGDTLAAAAGVEVTAAGRGDLDITDPSAVRHAVAGHDIVVNAAAYTDVDGAERDEETANVVNGTAVGHLAEACDTYGARLIQISTDYVFSGFAGKPYAEDALTEPANAYGWSKLLGESAVLKRLPDTGYVVRTAWLYGQHGRNFVTTMLRLAQLRDTVDVVADQRGQPTWTVALARQLRDLGAAALAGDAPPGVYHGTASGETTWHGLARAVFAAAGHDPSRVRAVRSQAFPRLAARPAYSVLGHDRWKLAGVDPQPDWVESLRSALATWGAS